MRPFTENQMKQLHDRLGKVCTDQELDALMTGITLTIDGVTAEYVGGGLVKMASGSIRGFDIQSVTGCMPKPDTGSEVREPNPDGEVPGTSDGPTPTDTGIESVGITPDSPPSEWSD